MRFWLILLYSILTNSSTLSAYILKPIKDSKTELSLIIVPGASISPEKYALLAHEIQKQSPRKLWVNIAKIPLNLANPLNINHAIEKAQEELRNTGARSSKVFVAGHSLGGSMIQHLNLNEAKIDGFVLLGSFIARNKKDYLKTIPSLTIAAELDGLTRLGRIAESYHLDIEVKKNQNDAKLHNPIYVIGGMNHSQFSSGDQPFLVRQRDLEPEISLDQAHEQVAKAIGNFFEYQVSPIQLNAIRILSQVNKTAKILRPFIEAMLLEGSYNLKPPCSQVDHQDCFQGSPWTSKMLVEFSGLEESKVKNTDEFRNVWRVFPFFHPKIENTCDASDRNCVLETRTVSQAVYEKLDSLDTAFAPVSASEIRVKFKSRQSIFTAVGEEFVDFDESDGDSECQKLNQLALDWAINASSSKALTRYHQKGIPMIMGPDLGPYNNGPQWIWSPLTMELMGGKLQVSSPCLKTPLDFPIKKAGGMHYCKLLSPARALEWIYTDSLRNS